MEKGLSLIEIIIAIGLVVIVGTALIIISNPAGQLAAARNLEREAHVNAIVNAIRQNIADNRTGIFSCAAGDIPTSTKKMATSTGNYDIAPCLVPDYIQILPYDPRASGARYVSVTDYNTEYTVLRSTSTPPEITVKAPFAELGKTISITR